VHVVAIVGDDAGDGATILLLLRLVVGLDPDAVPDPGLGQQD